MSVDEPAGSKEGQEYPIKELIADLKAERDWAMRCAEEVQVQLNAAIEASSIAEAARLTAEARIRKLEAALASVEQQFRFIVNILGPEVPSGLPDGADVEWAEALAAADVGLELSSPSTGEKASTEGRG